MYLGLFVSGTIFILSGIFWGIIGKSQLSHYLTDKKQCTVLTVADIISVDNPGGKRGAFLPTLEYMAKGQRVVVKCSSGGSIFRYLKEIPIYYNPSHSQQFIYDKRSIYFKKIFTLFFLGCGLGLFGIILCYFSFTV